MLHVFERRPPTRHTSQPRSRSGDIAAEAAAAEGAAAEDVDAHVHVWVPRAGGRRRLRRRAGLPGVVDEEGVAGLEEVGVQLVQGVLPLEQALGGEGVIPDDQAAGVGCMAGCCQVPAAIFEPVMGAQLPM